MATALHSQVSLANGLYLFADFFDQRVPDYKDRLARAIRIEQRLPDALRGIQPKQEVRVRLKNVAQWTPSSYGSVAVGEENTTYDVTASDIMAGSEGMTGRAGWARLYSLDGSTEIMRLDGTIVDAKDAAGGPLGMEEGELVINALDLNALQQVFPRVLLLDRFPDADLTDVSGGAIPVFFVFGAMRKVKLAYVGVFQGRHCFGAFRTPLTGALAWNTVYRNKAVVTSTEYTILTQNGCQLVGFTNDQRDSSGQRKVIQADVTSTEFTRPSDVGKYILNNPTYGLGLAVNNASFSAAATAYATRFFTVSGGLTQQVQVQTLLNKLAMHGAVIGRNSSGEYTWTVDEIGLHTPATVTLGLNATPWNVVRVLKKGQRSVTERIKKFVLQGLFDPGFEGSGSYLLTANRTRQALQGIESPAEQNEFIGDAVTLDKECFYRYKAQVNGEKDLSLQVEPGDLEVPQGRALALYQVVPVNIPNLRLNSTTDAWTVVGLAAENNAFEVELRGYNEDIFTYISNPVQAAPSASYPTDYSYTLPATPTNFSVTSSVFLVAGDSTKSAITTIEADAPAVNVTHLVFQVFRQGTAIPLHQREIRVTAGQINVQVQFRLPVGTGADNTYDLQCFARNVANQPEFRDGDVAQILNYVPGTDTTPPNVPTGLAATVGTGKTVGLVWTKNTDAVAEYSVYRNTVNNPASAVVIGQNDANTFVDVNVVIGTSYFYWVTATDSYENESAKSTGIGPIIPVYDTIDPTPPSNPGAMTFNSSTTYQASDGHTRATILMNGPSFPSGATLVNALYRRTGIPTWLIADQISTTQNLRFDDLTPGLNYDFALRAYSAFGVPSAIVQATGGPFTAPGDSTAPAQVTGLALADQPPRALRARWSAVAADDLKQYEVQSATDSGFTANLVTRSTKTTELPLTGLTNGTTYFVRVRAVDITGNAGTYSATASRTVPRNDDDDYGDDTIASAKFKNLSVTNAKIANLAVDNAKIANLAVTNAKINDLSAVKITTGLLTVNPSSGGATAIFVDNAGKIRLKAITGTPSKIVFEDSSAVEKAQIQGKPAELNIDPMSDGGLDLIMGEFGLRWGKILMETINRISLKSNSLDVFLNAPTVIAQGTGGGPLKIIEFNDIYLSGSFVIAAATGGAEVAKLRVKDSAGTLIGFIPIKAS